MMNSKQGPNKDQNLLSHYEEHSGDSDIESRLYAEIHYTNTIIGDESNLAQNLSNNGFGDKRTREHSSAIPQLQSQNNLQTSQSSNQADNPQKAPNASAQNNIGVSTTITNFVQDYPVQSQTNSNFKSKKRPIISDSHQNQSNKKKKKQQNKNDNVNDRNRIINPYHKNVVNNQQYGMKLLSPAFLHLFFGKSKGKKKKAAQKKLNTPAQPSVNISYDAPALNTPQENVLQNSIENQVIQNETEVNGAQDSETIIDICSESSQDSTEDNSKYNNIEATDKKLTKLNSMVDNENSDNDTSDSNESIFEVPVPPKPAPPIIELNDSDNENIERSDDTDSSSSSHDSYQANFQSINRSVSNITNITENLQEQEISDSERSEPSNLILNCTEIQEGVSSISDIKRMSHEISSKTSSPNETNATNASDISQSNLEVLDNAMSRENMASSVKEINSTVTKQVRKSPRAKDRRDRSFFQPIPDKMKSFYNDSWGGENFDLEKLKSNMTRDPKKWAILDDDLIASFSRRKRYFGMVCSRCQKNGHRQNQCPEPYKLPTCHMCGIEGHYETGCPEKKCLTCGKKQNMFRKTCEQCVRMVCTRCKARGHMEYFCPDLWRSYHQTVTNTKLDVPKNIKTVMKPQQSLYCCNCAKKGHDSQNCRKLRWSEHFPVPSHVTSYDGPEYSKENVGTESNLSNSNSYCENTLTPGNSSDKTTHRNLAHDKLPSFSRDQILDARKVIFEIKSKRNIGNKMLVKVNFNLRIPNKMEPSKYNYWNGLSKFLYELVNELSGEFILCQNKQQVVMEMHVPHKTRVILEKLIQQYAGRSNFERSYMYLSCDRNLKRVVKHLTEKFNEISNMTLPKDILEMYHELRSLKSSENEQASAFKDQKLIVCQKELLVALYRESCANDSLKKLQKLFKKLKTRVRLSGKMSLKKLKQKVRVETQISLKDLFEYLIYYNNVLVPYEPHKLDSFVNTYKKYLAQRERLNNNPLLFPQGNNKAGKSTTQSSSFNNTVTTEKVLTSSSSTSCEIPNLLLINTSTISQMQPIVSQIQTAISSNTPRPLLSINTSISNNFQFPQSQPVAAYNAEISSRKKMRGAGNYKHFLKNTKKLIAKAHDLNIPHVRKYVEVLENKIKNGIYLFEKDVSTLKVLLKKGR